MEILKNKQDCCGCHACYNACPVQTIEMQSDEEGFLYPVVQEEKCIQCGQCQKVCPAINKPETLPLEDAYGCYAVNMDERMSSSSGGMFSLFASAVLLENGVVCGAAYDENNEVFHFITSDKQDWKCIKETKYVQSRIGDIYKSVKAYLKNGRQVLFSGTPCQVAGLKSYLGQTYDNLLCMDIICHGVPSPEVWKSYLKEIAGDKKVVKVSFRNKQEGTANSTLDYYMNDGTVKKEKYAESLYMKGFLQNLFVRPSCFKCKYKGSKRCSDLTIGDFWGVKEYHPEFGDEFGTSAVILHSEKGHYWFEKIADKMQVVDATVDEVGCWNTCLFESVKENLNRQEFFRKWKESSVVGALSQLTIEKKPKERKLVTIISRLKTKIKEILK